MTTNKLMKLETVVTSILEVNEAARSDDYILFVEVCKHLKPETLTLSFTTAMLKHKELLPNWESVSRCRRKVQERRQDLVSERAKKRRAEETDAYIGYAHT